ncbi:hypothetical protein AAG906_020211 [Vitis piasezkii]
MSGPYGGALFSATTYDANDSILVMVLGKAKIVVGNKEVIIISDRHSLCFSSVPEVFGIENHAYCYRKENALQFLDSIEYGRHHSICNFLLEHMSKLASMLVKHQEESKNWKGCIGPKIEAKVQENIAKGAVYPVTVQEWSIWGMYRKALLNVDILNHTCTSCHVVIISIGQNVTDFVDDCYKYPMQELIYEGSFSGIETHDMPTVDDDGLEKLPKSRCSGRKFITVIARLPPEKHQAITDMGFGGLLTFACRELRYELCGWLISQYDFTYHRLKMATGSVVNVNEQHVSQVMGIPNSGEDLVIVKRTGPSNRTYTLRVLEQNLDNLPQPTYIRGCLMFLQLFYMAFFYMPSVIVEVTRPLAAAWSDDVIKRRLAAEISTFGGYGHVDAQEQPQSTPHILLPSVASTSTAGDDATEVIEARISETSETMLRLALSLVRDVEDAEEGEGAGGSGSQTPKPSSMKRYKRTAKRIVKRSPACKSPFVAQCVKQFPKIPHADRVVADYALAEMGDPSEILCDMYGMYIRREELSCLNARRWVNSMVVKYVILHNFAIVAIVSRMMNGQAPPLAHFLSLRSCNLKSNATTQVILERCAMYLDPDTLGHDLSSCDMILSLLLLRRGNNISAATRRLSMALHKARMHIESIWMRMSQVLCGPTTPSPTIEWVKYSDIPTKTNISK